MNSAQLEVIVCPVCQGKLDFVKNKDKVEQQLICKFDRLSYPIEDGIPVLISEKATSLTAVQIENLR